MKDDAFAKVEKWSLPSFRRKPESRKNKQFWTPAFAGVTALKTFYKAVKDGKCQLINGK
jgi:hypothetical protein